MKSDYELERDAVFVKDIDYIMEQLNAIKYVHTRDGKIHDHYVLEKLQVAKGMIDNSIDYWGGKNE